MQKVRAVVTDADKNVSPRCIAESDNLRRESIRVGEVRLELVAAVFAPA
jgi:hypothetical protein